VSTEIQVTLNMPPARGKAGTRTWQLVSTSTFSVVYFSINVIKERSFRCEFH
jgi:hypothetical protein